jgi:hypothetical protein
MFVEISEKFEGMFGVSTMEIPQEDLYNEYC